MTFITYSFIGWLWESFYCSIKAKHFVYRGFLLGPYCPVYGFGVTAVLLLVPEHVGSLLNLYFNVVVIVTVIEYITSWLLEKLFNMTLWNYSKIPMNIDGRVAVPVSLFWGVGCVLLIKVINPNIQDMIHDFVSATNGIGPIVLFVIFMIDVISTLIFTETTKKEVESVVDNSDPENASIKEYRMKHLFNNEKPSAVRERILHSLKSKPMKIRHYTLSRIVKNYPNIIFNKKRK
ncbi:putative ABC transporter permease [Enterococcus sp. LJL99]